MVEDLKPVPFMFSGIHFHNETCHTKIKDPYRTSNNILLFRHFEQYVEGGHFASFSALCAVDGHQPLIQLLALEMVTQPYNIYQIYKLTKCRLVIEDYMLLLSL